MRLHIGCGTVYLCPDWKNVDLPESGAKLAVDCPEGVSKWKTTDDAYYGRMDERRCLEVMANNPVDHSLAVCDAYGSWFGIPCEPKQADEILSRHVFEHLSMTEARKAMLEAHRVLKVGGVLRLDVPDIDETLELYRQTGDLFLKRHVIGSRKNEFAYHCVGWTKDGLNAFVERFGFSFVEWENMDGLHFYPAFCGRWVKQ